jgi:hypothetical protein
MASIAYSKFYGPFEHLAIDKMMVLFKGKVAIKHYIPKKHEHFRIKIKISVTCQIEARQLKQGGQDKW